MIAGGQLSFLVQPVLAFLGIGVLILILKWAFGRGSSVVAAPAKAGSASDYGLLEPIASPATYVEGEIWRRRLEDAGIRANLATTTDGPRVLVFPKDAERARSILREHA